MKPIFRLSLCLLFFLITSNITLSKVPAIAVFCSASNDIPQHIKETAYRLGSFIGAQRYNLITGGGTLGLMKCVVEGYLSKEVKERYCRNIVLHTHFDYHPALEEANIIQVESIHQRIDYIYENSDLFIVLPGGFGTLHELLDCFMQNKHKNKPIFLLNIDGFWNNIIQQFNIIIESNPTASGHLKSLIIVNTLSECQALLKETIGLRYQQQLANDLMDTIKQ